MKAFRTLRTKSLIGQVLTASVPGIQYCALTPSSSASSGIFTRCGNSSIITTNAFANHYPCTISSVKYLHNAYPNNHFTACKSLNSNPTSGCTGCQISAQKRKYGNKERQLGERRLSVSAKELVDASPPGIQSYLRLCRLDKPIGTWLVYLPCTWSIAMAAAPGCCPDPKMLVLFGAGSFLMRGAGCTINDMWDKDIDRQVRRTRDRPLASGQLTTLQALTFLGVQLSAALAILLTFDWNSVMLGSSVMLLVVTYPLMKRVTFWPQLFLGVTLNWGVLLSWSVLHGGANWQICIPLYIAGIMQTMIYDTIYAHRDKEDDLMIGVKSTALYMGDQVKTWLSSFASVLVGSLALSGFMADQTWPYYIGVSAVASHFAYQIYTVNLKSEDDCARKFQSNRNLGLLVFAAIVAGSLLKTKDKAKEEPEDGKPESGKVD